jgi:demethylmenaquinone methyltransferase/2-methoxy-6-polyprenyl-1,4-benzoquinol methylase
MPQEKIDQNFINNVFSSVSDNYDYMNDIMSGGIHRIWKKHFVEILPIDNLKFLDMASGSGDIAISIAHKQKKYNKSVDITLCDINKDMLDKARVKFINEGIIENCKFEVADAAKLPFEDNSFDIYTISFGIRNVPERKGAFLEAKRVLKPGGKLFCMEFSKVENKLVAPLYNFYLNAIIPNMGQVFAQNKEAYEYLKNSIINFPSQEEIVNELKDCGFSNVNYYNMTFGIVCIHVAQA